MKRPLVVLALVGCRPGPLDSGADDSAGPPDSGDTQLHDSSPPEDSASFGVLSLNLHCLFTSGTTFSDNEARFEAVAGAGGAEEGRVNALQGVCGSADAA